MATNKIQTGLRLNETTYEKVRALSVKENRSLNNLIEHVIQKFIDDYENKNGIIQTSPEE